MGVRSFAWILVLSSAVAGAGVLVLGAPTAFAQQSEIDALRSAARAHPADAAAALALGRGLRRAGRDAEALVELRRGLSLPRSEAGAVRRLHWEVARAYMDQRDFYKSMASCRTLGKLADAGADGHACAADAYLVWQRGTAAEDEASRALAEDGRNYEAKLAQGRAWQVALDPGKSEAAYRAALAEQPEGEAADAHLGLGRLLVETGRKDEGVGELRRALQADPNAPEVLFALADALGPGPESERLLEHATRERPSFAAAWLALGERQLAAGQWADAGRSAGQAIHDDPQSAAAHVLSGRAALAQGRPDDAIRAGRAALEIVANSAPAKLLVADGEAKKGEVDLALEAYQAAWGLDHADPTPLVNAAEACRAAGRSTSARAFGAKASQEFPRWGPAWAVLGDALAARGEAAAAKDAYENALKGDGPVDARAVRKKLSALE